MTWLGTAKSAGGKVEKCTTNYWHLNQNKEGTWCHFDLSAVAVLFFFYCERTDFLFLFLNLQYIKLIRTHNFGYFCLRLALNLPRGVERGHRDIDFHQCSKYSAAGNFKVKPKSSSCRWSLGNFHRILSVAFFLLFDFARWKITSASLTVKLWVSILSMLQRVTLSHMTTVEKHQEIIPPQKHLKIFTVTSTSALLADTVINITSHTSSVVKWADN